MPGIAATSPSIYELLEEGSAVEQLATGFTFTEGPIWHPAGGYLLFSDMPGDKRRRWDPQGGVRVERDPSNKCNGMTYDADLNLLVCEHTTSSLVRERPDGTRETLASHFEGRELNSPNDVTVRSDGSIYFSDPWYGRMPSSGGREQSSASGRLRIPQGRGAQCLGDEFAPNGLCFSPGESPVHQRHAGPTSGFDERRRLALQRLMWTPSARRDRGASPTG